MVFWGQIRVDKTKLEQIITMENLDARVRELHHTRMILQYNTYRSCIALLTHSKACSPLILPHFPPCLLVQFSLSNVHKGLTQHNSVYIALLYIDILCTIICSMPEAK